MDKLQIKGLCFSYGEEPILNNLNLTVEKGKPLVLLGKSGIGKTTLLNLILGFIKPNSGEISGIDETTRVSVMYQEDRLFPQISVYKNLKLVKKELNLNEAGKLLSELGLEKNILNKLPGELSGGMRRRIALARCLIFPAELVLMDEPFKGLDIESRKKCLGAVKKYIAERPALIISHDPHDAEAIGAETVRMEDIAENR